MDTIDKDRLINHEHHTIWEDDLIELQQIKCSTLTINRRGNRLYAGGVNGEVSIIDLSNSEK